MSLRIARDVPIAPLTTFNVGGTAAVFAEAESADDVRQALGIAANEGLELLIVGGGSNILVADGSLRIFVLTLNIPQMKATAESGGFRFDVGASVRWDDFVAQSVAQDLFGLAALSGIPGSVGATPVQNVGAYGQEVRTTITEVVAIDRQTLEERTLSNAECAFAYRDSAFKRHFRDRFVITSVRFTLSRGDRPEVTYPDLARALPNAARATPSDIRNAVLAIRRSKSMVIEPGDENARSAGSFFTNPVIDLGHAERLTKRLQAAGFLSENQEVPKYAAGDGAVKVPAAWLIERAGFTKGFAEGTVGISSRHCLCIVNRGGATARDIVRFATRVKRRVRDEFGVALEAEPTLVGFVEDEASELLGS